MMELVNREIDTVGRHLEMLELVVENEPIDIMKMSSKTEYSEHRVRYSLRVLEENNLIKPTTQGAVTTDQASDFVESLDNELDVLANKLQAMKIDHL